MKKGTSVIVLSGVIMDKYLVTERYPVHGGDEQIIEVYDHVGGCSINVAYTLKNLGSEPYIVSSVGRDSNGDMIMGYLAQNRMKTDLIYRSSVDTGYCITILDGSGERTFMTYRGCEDDVPEDILDSPLMGSFSHAYVTGYHLLGDHGLRIKLDLLKRLQGTGTVLVFDPGSLVGKIDREALAQVLDLADILVPNRHEAALMMERLDTGVSFSEWLKKRNYSLVVLKNGAGIVEGYSEGRAFHASSYKVNSVDTTGAGDSFAGGLIFALQQGYTVEQALETACACGAITTTFREPHGRFDLSDVEKLRESRVKKNDNV